VVVAAEHGGFEVDPCLLEASDLAVEEGEAPIGDRSFTCSGADR
jgi:hypothetical protein